MYKSRKGAVSPLAQIDKKVVGVGGWTVFALRACVSVLIIKCLIGTVKHKLVQCFARPSDKWMLGGWQVPDFETRVNRVSLSTFERFTSLAGLIGPLLEHIFLPFLV
jgi:hypothetical protein